MATGNEYVRILADFLKEKDKIRLENRLQRLIEDNHSLGMPKGGFLFAGRFHTLLRGAQLATAEKRVLHPQLYGEARAYIADTALFEKELTRLSNGLQLLLRTCWSLQDVRDALPDVIVALRPELSSLPRQRPEAWPLLNQPLHLHQYQETRNLLEFYAVNRVF